MKNKTEDKVINAVAIISGVVMFVLPLALIGLFAWAVGTLVSWVATLA